MIHDLNRIPMSAIEEIYSIYELKKLFEKLSGKLKDKCSIRVNNQWRIIFIWDDERGEADGIYLDNHTYK